MVTHSTTNLPVSGLSMGEQTGPRILHYLWSYVLESRVVSTYNQLVHVMLAYREKSVDILFEEFYLTPIAS
jgi:hypothetical protein